MERARARACGQRPGGVGNVGPPRAACYALGLPWGLLREHLEIYNGDNLETEVHRMLKEASLGCAFC